MKARLASLRHAFNGLSTLLREQHNARMHFLIAAMVVIAGFWLQLALSEWLVVILLIGWIISLEALNSALEYLCDKVSAEQHPLIGKAKDVSAAAVLVSAMTAAVIGGLIFLPKVLLQVNQ